LCIYNFFFFGLWFIGRVGEIGAMGYRGLDGQKGMRGDNGTTEIGLPGEKGIFILTINLISTKQKIGN